MTSIFLIYRYYEEFKKSIFFNLKDEEDEIVKVKKAFFFLENFIGERTIYQKENSIKKLKTLKKSLRTKNNLRA